MERLNVVVISDFAHVNGGAAQVALSSAMALAERGHQVTVFAAVPPVSPELRLANLRVVCLDQYEIVSDPNRLRAFVQGIWNVKAMRSMGTLLSEMAPSCTIIHLHGWTKALSSSVIRKCVRQGFRVVCSLHDYFVACPNGGFFLYPKNTICHIQALSKACLLENCDKRNYAHKLWRVLRQIVQKRWGFMPGGVRYFIVASELTRSVLRNYLPSGAELYQLGNPIDVHQAEPVRVRDNSEFVMIGRLGREKGCELFAEAAMRVGCRAVFIGDGECRSELLSRFPTFPITGWCTRADVLTHLSRARALVFPSRLYETQGLAALEAAAVGVPALVSDTCVARESVIHGETGLWFRGGDVNDLAQKLRLLMKPDLAAQMGLAAYDRYWARPCTLNGHVDQLVTIYRRVLSD